MERASRLYRRWLSLRVAIAGFIVICIPLWGQSSARGEQKNDPVASKMQYTSRGMQDPFRPFLETDALRTRAQERLQVVPLSPLLRSPVESFRLLGIVGDLHRRMAVVEDSEGKFHTLLPGSHIGNRDGQVVGIHRDHLIVEETVRSVAGREKREKVRIKFHKEELEGKP
ncbi:MAG: pilus assembly protein PilP [Smithellaceae bacterium]|nr:pilus assembly protein PilP [Smithellaceae bacterium]